MAALELYLVSLIRSNKNNTLLATFLNRVYLQLWLADLATYVRKSQCVVVQQHEYRANTRAYFS
jgi:hypothetical protein